MSLGGLAVAIGLIIDDTVVVIENIARHLAEGQTGDAAVDRGQQGNQRRGVGSTLTTILVFVPLAFVHGVVGQFFQSLSIALSIALLVSMVVSLTIIPVLASRFLARRPMPSTGPIYNFLAAGYEGLLRVGLRVPRLTMLLALSRCSFPAGGCCSISIAASCPTWMKGRSSSITRCRSARRLGKPTRFSGVWKRCCSTRRTSPATSAAPGRKMGCLSPNRSPAIFW